MTTAFKCLLLCCKVLKLSNMGIEAVKSHSQNAKHRRLVETMARTVVTDTAISRFFQIDGSRSGKCETINRPPASVTSDKHESEMTEVVSDLPIIQCDTVSMGERSTSCTKLSAHGNKKPGQLGFATDDLKYGQKLVGS